MQEMVKGWQRAIIGLAILAVSGCVQPMADNGAQVWRDSFSRDANGKWVCFIPPELWAGASWNGDRDLNRLPPFYHQARTNSGSAPVHIRGPIRVSPADHPTCTRPVYKLAGARHHGDKIEYYQIDLDTVGKKGGIGRCWRSQAGRAVNLNETSKFSIGSWAEKEKFGNIRILDLGTPDSPCLEFSWTGGRDGGSWGEYTYCPGQGRIKANSRRKTERGH